MVRHLSAALLLKADDPAKAETGAEQDVISVAVETFEQAMKDAATEKRVVSFRRYADSNTIRVFIEDGDAVRARQGEPA